MYIRGLIINNPCVDSRPEDVKKRKKKKKAKKVENEKETLVHVSRRSIFV